MSEGRLSATLEKRSDQRLASKDTTLLQRVVQFRQGPYVLLLIALGLLAIFLRSHELLTVSAWFDEACSWKVSQFPLAEMLDANGRDAHPPLYYLVLKVWMQIFGNSLFSARALTIFFAVLGVGAGMWFISCSQQFVSASSVWSRREAIAAMTVAGILIILNPLQVEMGQAARSYTLGLFLAILSAGFLLKAVQAPERKKYWLGFALSSAGLTLTHYYALFTFCGLLVFLLLENLICIWRQHRFQSRTRQMLLGSVASLWLIQLIWMPWVSTFLFQRNRSDKQLWMGPLTWDEVFQTCWQALASGKASEVWPDYVRFGIGVWIALGLVVFITRGRIGRLVGLCSTIPLGCVIFYGFQVRNILGTQYLIYAQIFVLLSVAVLALPGRFTILRWTFVVMVLCWNSWWLSQYVNYRTSLAQLPGTQSAIAYLNQQRETGTPVIFSSPFVHTIAQLYLKEKPGCHTQNYGDHRDNLLSGPALQDQDYMQTREVILSRPAVVWTVDADKLFGGRSIVSLPNNYEPVSEQVFEERYGFVMDLVVRKYVRQDR